MKFKSTFYLFALMLISASPSIGYAFLSSVRDRFSSGGATQHFRRIRSSEIQALPDFMITAIQEVKAVKAAEERKEDELQELKKQLIELQNSNSPSPRPLASVGQAAAAAAGNQNGNPAATSSIIDTGEMTGEQMQLDLLMFQEFMKEYLVEAHEEKLKAIEAAEVAIKSEYEEKIKLLLLQEGCTKNEGEDESAIATNLIPLPKSRPSISIESSNGASKIHDSQSIGSNANIDMTETEATTTTAAAAAAAATSNIGKIIVKARSGDNDASSVAGSIGSNNNESEKRQGRDHLPGSLADRISLGTEFQNKKYSSTSPNDDDLDESSPPPPVISQTVKDESPIVSASRAPKIPKAAIPPTTAVDSGLRNTTESGSVPPPSLAERIALGIEVRTLSPVETSSPLKTKAGESSPIPLPNQAESSVPTVGADSSPDSINKERAPSPAGRIPLDTASQPKSPLEKSTTVTAFTPSTQSDVGESEHDSTIPNDTLETTLSVVSETDLSPARSEDESNTLDDCPPATASSVVFQAHNESAVSVHQPTNQQDDEMPAPQNDFPSESPDIDSQTAGEASSESTLATSTRVPGQDTNGIDSLSSVDRTSPGGQTKSGPKQFAISTTLRTPKAETKTKSISFEDKIRIATAKSINEKMSIRLSPNSCGRENGPSISQTVNSFSRFQTSAGLRSNTMGSSRGRVNPGSQLLGNSGDVNAKKIRASVGDKVTEMQENVGETHKESSSKRLTEGNDAPAALSTNKQEKESTSNEKIAKLEAAKEEQRLRLVALDRMNAARLAKGLHRPKQPNALVIERRGGLMEPNGSRTTNSRRISSVIQSGIVDGEARQADNNLNTFAGKNRESLALAFRPDPRNDRERFGSRIALGSTKIRNRSTALNVSPATMSYPVSSPNTLAGASVSGHERQANKARSGSPVDPFKLGPQVLRPNSRGAPGSMFGSVHGWR